MVTVIIQVKDVNDNAPQFQYSSSVTDHNYGVNGAYFAVVSDNADPFTPVLTVKVRQAFLL